MVHLTEKHLKILLLSILVFGLVSCHSQQNKIENSADTLMRQSSSKLDSTFLLKTSFFNGQLFVYAIVDKTGKGLLHAKYMKNEKVISGTQTEVIMTQDSLKYGIVFNENKDSMMLHKHCVPFDNLMFFCLNSATYLNGTDMYAVRLDKDNLNFLKLTGDKFDLLTSEGYWVVQKNKKYFIKVNPYRGSRDNNVTLYAIKDDLIVFKKEIHEQFLEENDFPANNIVIQIYRKIIKNEP